MDIKVKLNDFLYDYSYIVLSVRMHRDRVSATYVGNKVLSTTAEVVATKEDVKILDKAFLYAILHTFRTRHSTIVLSHDKIIKRNTNKTWVYFHVDDNELDYAKNEILGYID